MNEHGHIVSVEWLLAHLGEPGVVVIDARPDHEYREGHIPGARHSDQNAIRMRDSSESQIAQFVTEATAECARLGLRPGDRVIFYEAISGCYAARGVWMLDYLGIPGGAILDGGLTAWLEAGGGYDQSLPNVESTIVTPDPDRSTLATASELVDSLDGEAAGKLVLDTRGDLEFISGTIPGSVHLEWTRTLDERGRFRPLEELRALYAEAGLTAEAQRSVATFCGAGYRAAHSYIVLKALGFEDVTNYAPSWNEWGIRSDLPIERPNRSASAGR